MQPDYIEKLEASAAALRDLRQRGVIGDDDFHKAILCLAYEYSVGGDSITAAAMAQSIPRAYYLEVQRGQMALDPNFAYVSYTLALNLFQEGLVHLGPAIKPTMAPASA